MQAGGGPHHRQVEEFVREYLRNVYRRHRAAAPTLFRATARANAMWRSVDQGSGVAASETPNTSLAPWHIDNPFEGSCPRKTALLNQAVSPIL